MTQEEKQLLLRDLCGRLRYGVTVHATIDGDNTLSGIYNDRVFTTCEEPDKHNDYPVECIKPYLRPMSSMTEEEENELTRIAVLGGYNNSVFNSFVVVDWLNAHHLDYRGLIEKGLALEAPADMYKNG